MEQATVEQATVEQATVQYSFANLFDPAMARAAVERAAQWKLPRRVCRPLDHYIGPYVNADSVTFDAEIELDPISEELLAQNAAQQDDANDYDVGEELR